MSETETKSFDSIVDSVAKDTLIPKSQLKEHAENWIVALMEKGIVVNIDIKRWRANTKINPDEVGIDETNNEFSKYEDNYMTLGYKKLLPKNVLKEISKIETKSRKNLKDRSIKTVWGYFVPHTSFIDWKEANDEIRKDFFDMAEQISVRWKEIVEEVCGDYLKYINSIYINKLSGQELTDTITSLVNNFRSLIISVDDFRRSFEYETYYSYIPLPSFAKKELLEVEKVEAERHLLASEVEMQQQIQKEFKEKKSKQIDEFIQATAGAIGESTSRIMEEVRMAIGKDGDKEVSPIIKKKLLKLIENVRTLDFYQEEKTVSCLNQLEVDLKKTDDTQKKKTLNDIKESVESFERAANEMLSNWVYGAANQLELI